MSVVKAKTALHADRLDMHAARIAELESIVGVLVDAVDKLTHISDGMDREFSGRLSFLEVIAE